MNDLLQQAVCHPAFEKAVQHFQQIHKQPLAILGIALLLVATSGCGADGQQTIKGTVTLDGTPLSDGRISLQPTQSGSTASAAITEGAYTIPLSVESHPTSFVVRISSPQPTGKMISHPDAPGGKMEEIRESIPDRYNNASELTIELNSPADDTFDFDLIRATK
ncbi:hypothetical protein [Aeoliella sp.]|uniref:hypothetical protein n=1 Tax=Aeoliella sp. TaxID=2795800 RepID=UPI003CCBA090